ncbi:MAG: hypothetical protein ABWZ80_00480 [Beijerinckiaceae bacterium]
MDSVGHAIESFIARGDLAHLALALWACGATAFCFALLRALSIANHQLAATAREVSSANRHVKEFVRQLSNFNRRNAVANSD